MSDQIADATNRDDAQWFARHPRACHRARPSVPGEVGPDILPPGVAWAWVIVLRPTPPRTPPPTERRPRHAAGQ